MTGDGEVGCGAPPRAALPPFDRGWDAADGQVQPFLSYVDSHQAVNWSPNWRPCTRRAAAVTSSTCGRAAPYSPTWAP